MLRYTRFMFMILCAFSFFMPVKFASSQVLQEPVLVVAQSDMTRGDVRRIDKENKKITIRHDEIRDLNMPPMTMVFQVRDAALLDRVRIGDKVRFRAVEEGGTLVITDMEPDF
jgi:Cu/Ag efflux protein CusF